MKLPEFKYLRPCSLNEAVAMLDDVGDGGQIIAGGQSLVPTLSLRLSMPSVLVDINRVEDACPLELRDGTIHCGACVRHAELERSPMIQAAAPLLALAMPHVAHPAIRNRGTPCGSIALSDPAAEIPACALALNASVVLQGAAGRRSVSADDYFLGLYETARQPGEVVVELQFPAARPTQRFGFVELARRRGDFAIVGIAVVAELDAERIASLRLVIFGCEGTPRVSRAAGAIARGCELQALPLDDVAAAVAAELDPMENAQGDADSKRQQARALTQRVLRQITLRAAA